MYNWTYIPEIGAYVDMDDLPEQLVGHPALRGRDVIADLEESKATVRENPNRMLRNLNKVMAML